MLWSVIFCHSGMLLHPGPRCVIQQIRRHYSWCVPIWACYVHYTPLIWSSDMVILRQILMCMVAVSFKTCLRLHTNSIFLLAQVSWNEYNSTAVASVTAVSPLIHGILVTNELLTEDATFLTRAGRKQFVHYRSTYLWGGLEASIVRSFICLILFLSRTLRNFPYQGFTTPNYSLASADHSHQASRLTRVVGPAAPILYYHPLNVVGEMVKVVNG